MRVISDINNYRFQRIREFFHLKSRDENVQRSENFLKIQNTVMPKFQTARIGLKFTWYVFG